jgi:hypothetical protein
MVLVALGGIGVRVRVEVGVEVCCVVERVGYG